MGGVVTGLVRRYTKRGELMATFVLEDLRASIEVFVFPKVMAEIGALLADDAVVVRAGPARHRGRPGEAGLHGDRTDPSWPPTESASSGSSSRSGSSPTGRWTGSSSCCPSTPATSRSSCTWAKSVLRLPAEFNVDSRRGLLGELRMLLGPAVIVA